MILIFLKSFNCWFDLFSPKIRIFQKAFNHYFSYFTVKCLYFGAGFFVVVFRTIEKVFQSCVLCETGLNFRKWALFFVLPPHGTMYFWSFSEVGNWKIKRLKLSQFGNMMGILVLTLTVGFQVSVLFWPPCWNILHLIIYLHSSFEELSRNQVEHVVSDGQSVYLLVIVRNKYSTCNKKKLSISQRHRRLEN